MYGYKSVYDAYAAPFLPMPTYYVAYDGTADDPGGDLELGNVVSSARLPPGADNLPLTRQRPPPKEKNHAVRFASLGIQPQDERPLVLFDLNGVLLQHTRISRTNHTFSLRPGVEHILRLLPEYRLGVYSSATRKTMLSSLFKLHKRLCEAVGGETKKEDAQGIPDGAPPPLNELFPIVMTRDHCRAADPSEVAARGGNPWDTIKPLGEYFESLDRVILIDDSAHKASPGEASSMVVTPCWAGNQHGADDDVLEALVDGLLRIARDGQAGTISRDIREHTASLSASLAELPSVLRAAARLQDAAKEQQQQQTGGAEAVSASAQRPADEDDGFLPVDTGLRDMQQLKEHVQKVQLHAVPPAVQPPSSEMHLPPQTQHPDDKSGVFVKDWGTQVMFDSLTLGVYEDKGGPGSYDAAGGINNGTPGQVIRMVHAVDGHPSVLPTTEQFAAQANVSNPTTLGFSCVHHEVVEFARRASPTAEETRSLELVLRRFDEVVRQLWPGASTSVFGSQATGLSLPGADVDVVVLGVGEPLEKAGTGFSPAQRRQQTQLLEDLLDALLGAGLIQERAEIIDARIPIIKCSMSTEGASAAVPTDISLGAANGAAAAAFLRAQMRGVPPLRPLTLVLKALLQQAGSNTVFTGGLSSYSLVNMILAYLQGEGYQLTPVDPSHEALAFDANQLTNILAFLEELRDGTPPAPQPEARTGDLGRLLWGFCHMYGHAFDYVHKAVSAARGGIVPKLKAWKHPRKPWLLTIEDPQEAGRDIAGGSFLIREVQGLLAQTADHLGELLEDLQAQGGAGLDESEGPAVLSSVLDLVAALGRGEDGINARKLMAIRDAERTAAMRVTRSNTKPARGKKRGRSDSEEPTSSRKRSRGDPERASRGKKKKGKVQGRAGDGPPRMRPYMKASKRQRLMDEWRNNKGQFFGGDDDMPRGPAPQKPARKRVKKKKKTPNKKGNTPSKKGRKGKDESMVYC